MTRAVAPRVREGRSHYIGRGKKKEASDVRFHREKKRVATLSEHARKHALEPREERRDERREEERVSPHRELPLVSFVSCRRQRRCGTQSLSVIIRASMILSVLREA